MLRPLDHPLDPACTLKQQCNCSRIPAPPHGARVASLRHACDGVSATRPFLDAPGIMACVTTFLFLSVGPGTERKNATEAVRSLLVHKETVKGRMGPIRANGTGGTSVLKAPLSLRHPCLEQRRIVP
eukprot:1147314-Pelagomonas_calceolata.AAC.5